MSGEIIPGAAGFDLCPICGKLKTVISVPVCLYCSLDSVTVVWALRVADVIGLFVFLGACTRAAPQRLPEHSWFHLPYHGG